jgi:hypothetical protein
MRQWSSSSGQLLVSDDRGQGRARCNVCGKPVRDHRIRPCPELGRDTIYVGEPGRRGSEPLPNSIRRRKYRRKSQKKA